MCTGADNWYIMTAYVAQSVARDIDMDRGDFRDFRLKTADGMCFALVKGVEGEAAWGLGTVDVRFVVVLCASLRTMKQQISTATLTIFRAQSISSSSPRATCSFGLLGRT